MSLKSTIYQAFLTVIFATLCYSRLLENLALNKTTKCIVEAWRSVDEIYTSHSNCYEDVCELVVDLKEAHVVNTVIVEGSYDCTVEKEIVYSVGLKKNKYSADLDYICQVIKRESTIDKFKFNDTITCDHKEGFQYVALKTDFPCIKYINEFQVFDTLSTNNLALKKNAEFIVPFFNVVDGDFDTISPCQDYNCYFVVDLGASHKIETVNVKAHVECMEKTNISYVIGLKYDMKSVHFDYSCLHTNQHSVEGNIDLKMDDTIICKSENAFQFVVFKCHFECYNEIEEIQIFGAFFNPVGTVALSSRSVTFPSNSTKDTDPNQDDEGNLTANVSQPDSAIAFLLSFSTQAHGFIIIFIFFHRNESVWSCQLINKEEQEMNE